MKVVGRGRETKGAGRERQTKGAGRGLGARRIGQGTLKGARETGRVGPKTPRRGGQQETPGGRILRGIGRKTQGVQRKVSFHFLLKTKLVLKRIGKMHSLKNHSCRYFSTDFLSAISHF